LYAQPLEDFGENSLDNVLLTSSPWIVAAPFLVGAIIILMWPFHRQIWMKTLAMVLSVGAVTYGLGHSLGIFQLLQSNPDLPAWQVNWTWFTSSSFTLAIGVLVDHLAAIMLIVVTTVSLLVQVYTHGYMREDPGYCRFYAYLSLFTGSMLGLVVATNLFQMYFFWELVGVCSYFLIGFWWYKVSAAEAALKAFVVNRIGDFGFLVGILAFLYATYGFWQGHPLLQFVDPSGTAGGFDLTGAIKWGTGQGLITTVSLATISILIFMGPMAKSAQAPLHVWLPDAMEGPTPISALIHAATMVAAGVYLVARAYPLWLTPDGSTHSVGLAVVAWVGTFTAFMAATIALSQFDIKRVLAWSTVSQLGYMFAGLGCGAYTAGMFHLFNHAFFKAMLFLCSGAVIHGLHGEQDIRKMGGLASKMPLTHICFLIGTLSISGFPLFSGFFSKDEILAAANHFSVGPLAGLMGPVLTFTAGLTAFYMFRAYFMTFSGAYRGDAHPHESPLVMTVPLLVLAVPSMLSGYLGTNLNTYTQVGSAFPNPFASFLYFGEPEYEPLHVNVALASLAAFIIGAGLSFMVYRRNLGINTWFQTKLAPLYQFSFNKWYFDEVYLGFVQKALLPVYNRTWSIVDKGIVDGIVNMWGLIAIGTGEVMRYGQNGRGQYYVVMIFACVAGLSLLVYFTRP
jgi:NAD(P)H-quinone oxidoreductase subunit 5